MLDQLNDSTTTDKVVTFSEVKKGKEVFYKISNVDKMRPFFMTIVSDSNPWMFIARNGGISDGRKK